MFDLNRAGGHEVDEILVVLNTLKAYKMLDEFGISIPHGKTIDIKFIEDDCNYSSERISSQFTKLLTNDEVEVAYADEERGKILGYELFISPDEGTYYDYIINEPNIKEYFNYWKRKAGWPDPTTIKNAYGYIEDKIFTDMCDEIIGDCPYDYTYGYSSYIGNTFELVFLVSDDTYIKHSPECLYRLVELAEYCKAANESIRIKEEKEAEKKKQAEFKKREDGLKCLKVS